MSTTKKGTKRSRQDGKNTTTNLKRTSSAIDIEDMYSAILPHIDTSKQLLHTEMIDWYTKYRRKLPWRGDAPPYDKSDKMSSASRHTPSTSDTKRNVGNKVLTSYFSIQKDKKTTCYKTQHDGHTDKLVDLTEERKLDSPHRQSCQQQHHEDGNDNSTGSDTFKEESCNLDNINQVSPYGTWVSEIMLQQTRVESVIRYYLKWMSVFPTIKDLAEADLENVNEHWAGLGYYRRAKLLHAGANYVMEHHDGKLPSTVPELLKVPGIGEYTAGAIASIAFKQPVPLVDGNVIRVFSRWFGIAWDAKSINLSKAAWKAADRLIHDMKPGEWNQSLMELGATVCTPTNPTCDACPVKGACTAYNWAVHGNGMPVHGHVDPEMTVVEREVTIFPIKTVKQAIRHQYWISIALIRSSDKTEEAEILLVKRPDQGLLAGHWELPSVLVLDTLPKERKSKQIPQSPKQCTDGTIRRELLHTRINGLVGTTQSIEWCRQDNSCAKAHHIFSHVEHAYSVETGCITATHSDIQDDNDHVHWVPLNTDTLKRYGLSTCMCKVLHAGISIFDKKQERLSTLSEKSRLVNISQATLTYVATRAGAKSVS